MSIFSFFTLLGGLAFFLYGMRVMSDGLEKASNGKLNSNLKKVTSNKFLAIFFGAVLTIAVQSSSAVTVMLVGLVNSGIIEFGDTLAICMGSNIGTTLTAWILSLAGIQSDVFWINLLKPENFSPLFALIGILMIMGGKKERTKSIGDVLIGFAVLMFGMELMSTSMEPLAEMPEFRNILTAFENPILALTVGTVFTGIIQSSAASIAILQALSITGGITVSMAVPVIVGQNIGTCVTALISSIGVNRNARKVAVAHISIKILGAIVCLVPFCLGNALFNWQFTSMNVTPVMIAIIHSAFNIITTMIFLPFLKQIEQFVNRMIPDEEAVAEEAPALDERILKVPTVAVQQSYDEVIDMCRISKDAFLKAADLLENYSEEATLEIGQLENRLDEYEDHLSTYMMKLSKIGVSDEDSKSIAKVLYTMADFERIGDYAVNLADTAKHLHDKQLMFTSESMHKILNIAHASCEIVSVTSKAFEDNDLSQAALVEPLEDVIDKLILDLRQNHFIEHSDNSTIELSFALSDTLTCFSRIAGHCSNIAVAVIEAQNGTFDTHEYLSSVRSRNNEEFNHQFAEYERRFSID